MASPVHSATIAILDAASGPMNQITASYKRLNAMMEQSMALAKQSNVLATQGVNGIVRYSQGMQSAEAQTKAMNNTTEKFNITMTGMLRLMVMFQINMELLRVATSPITFLRDAITQANEFQVSLQRINVMLHLGQSELVAYGQSLQQISANYGQSVTDTLAATQEISKTVNSLNRGNLSSQSASLEIMAAAARAASIDGSNLTDVARSLTSIMYAMRTPVSDVNDMMKVLFATATTGNVTMQQLNDVFSNIAGTLISILPDDPTAKMKTFTESMAILSTLTHVQSPQQAGTSFQSMIFGIEKRTPTQVKAFADVSARTGMDLSTSQFVRSPVQYEQNYAAAIEKLAPGLGAAINAANPSDPNVSDAALAGVVSSATTTANRASLAAMLDPNRRDFRGQMITIQEQGKNLQNIFGVLQTQIASFDESVLAVQNTMTVQWNRIKAIMTVVEQIAGSAAVKDFTVMFKSLADNLSTLLPALTTMNPGQALVSILDNVSITLSNWYHGGGDRTIQTFAQTFIAGLIEFLTKGVDDNLQTIIGIGNKLATGLMQGVIQGITSPSMLTGPFGMGAILSMITGQGYVKSVITAALGGNILGGGTLGGGAASGGMNTLLDIGMMGMMMGGGGGFGGVGGGIRSLLIGDAAAADVGSILVKKATIGQLAAAGGAGGAAIAGAGGIDASTAAIVAASGGRGLAGVLANLSGLTEAKAAWASLGTIDAGNASYLSKYNAAVSSAYESFPNPTSVRVSQVLKPYTAAENFAAQQSAIAGGFDTPAARQLINRTNYIDSVTGKVVSRADAIASSAEAAASRGIAISEATAGASFVEPVGLAATVGLMAGAVAPTIAGAGVLLGANAFYSGALGGTDVGGLPGFLSGQGNPSKSFSTGIANASKNPTSITAMFGQAASAAQTYLAPSNSQDWSFVAGGDLIGKAIDVVQATGKETAGGFTAGAQDNLFRALGIPSTPANSNAILGPLLAAGTKAGLKGADLNRYMAISLATINQESGFDPSRTNMTGKDGALGGSFGLFQLNRSGQGKGMSIADMLNPAINAAQGGAAIAAMIAANPVNASDPDYNAKIAILSGHPGGTWDWAQGNSPEQKSALSLARGISADTQKYLTGISGPNADTIYQTAVAQGGITGANGQMTMTVGTINLYATDPTKADAFIKIMSEHLVAQGGTHTP